jgi:Rieske Fe-S protein
MRRLGLILCVVGGLIGFAIGCEVHVQRALFGFPATPILLAIFGGALGRALGARRGESAASRAIAAVRWILFTLLLVISTAMLVGAVIFVVVVLREPPESLAKKEMDKDKVKMAPLPPQDMKHLALEPVGGGFAGGSIFKVGVPADYEEGQVVDRIKNRGVFLVRFKDEIFALASTCSCKGQHPVNWLEHSYRFKCPNCGSGFRITGVNFEGPATRPLERLGVRVSADGRLEIDPQRRFRKELGQWADPDSFVRVP